MYIIHAAQHIAMQLLKTLMLLGKSLTFPTVYAQRIGRFIP